MASAAANNGGTVVQIVPCLREDELAGAGPAYIELDLRRRTLLASAGNDPSRSTSHGIERRYSIPALTGEAADRVMSEILPLAERVVADWTESVDGSNVVAELGPDAQEAEDDITDFLGLNLANDPLGVQGFSNSDLVGCWDPSETLHRVEIAEHGITAETTDERLDEIGEDILQALTEQTDSAVAVCPGLRDYLSTSREYLRKVRDELADT